MESVAVRLLPNPATAAPKHDVDSEPLPFNSLFEKQEIMTKVTPFDAYLRKMKSHPLPNYSKPREIPENHHADDILVGTEHHQDNEDDQSQYLDFSCFPLGHFAPEFDKTHEAFPILPEDFLPRRPMRFMVDLEENVPCFSDASEKNTNSSIEPLPAFLPSAAEVVSPYVALSPEAKKFNDQPKDVSKKPKKSSTVNDRFKPFHEEKWNLRYKELQEFVKENGHGAVPHAYPKNPHLARWVKRQRRQYKLREMGKTSTMTAERLDVLNSVGFVWDSHDAAWREKFDALKAYRRLYGDCNVPSSYKDKKLATWVKCQRRQYKLYWQGQTSAMCPERICELEGQGFEWEIRMNLSDKGDDEDHELLQQQLSDF